MELYLPNPVFTHGQLYVALSKVQSKYKISILVKDGRVDDKPSLYIKNIVYKEILQ